MLFIWIYNFPHSLSTKPKNPIPWCYKLYLSSSRVQDKRASHTFTSPQQHRRLRRMPSPSKDKHKPATHSHNSMQRLRSLKPENTAPELDMHTSLSHTPANWTVKLTMNISKRHTWILLFKEKKLSTTMPRITHVISFYYGKSHIYGTKKLGTMMQWATYSHSPMPRNRSPTSTLRAQLLSLTLGMGTIVAETCKLNSEACNEHIKSTHFKKKMGTVNRRLKPHDIHLNRCIGTHPPTCLQDEIACTPQLPTPMPLPHPPGVSTRPLPSGPDKIERYSDSRIIFLSTAHAFEWKQHIYVFRAIHHIDPLHRKQALQFSRSHGQTLQKPREVQEMLQIPVCQSSLVSRTFSVHIRIWMFTLCTMHLVSTSTSEPRKEVLGNLYNFMH